MESYILITYLNDFIFCPRSIYYHNIYGEYHSLLYYRKDQLKGKAAHSTLEQGRYSTRKNILMDIFVFSEEYGLGGKIDMYDGSKKLLRERKRKISEVYDGYIYQLYGQYVCMQEMGYTINKLELYSMEDNKTYPVPLPHNDPRRFKAFKNIIEKIRTFNPDNLTPVSPKKCKNCIYNHLCDNPYAELT